MRRIPVLIAGGGPVGLALAVELGWRGVACELVEQGDGSIATPKMNEVNTRTMEFCRRWGIADAVLDCPFPADYPLDVAFVTTLSGYELARVPRPPRGSQTPEPHSPHRLQACSQIWFDPILQRLARTFPTVRLRYGRRLELFTQSGAGVTAEVVDAATGEREEIATDYLVGCDGGNSLVRRILGLRWSAPARSAIRRACSSARRTCWSGAAGSPRPFFHRSSRAVVQRALHRSAQQPVAADG